VPALPARTRAWGGDANGEHVLIDEPNDKRLLKEQMQTFSAISRVEVFPSASP
jgi:hypothetical protein